MQMLKNALACPTPVVIQRYSRDSRSRPSSPLPSSLPRDATSLLFLYLWLADKSTAASTPPPFALASSPRCYYLCTTRYAPQHNFLVYFCPLSSNPLCPAYAGEERRNAAVPASGKLRAGRATRFARRACRCNRD